MLQDSLTFRGEGRYLVYIISYTFVLISITNTLENIYWLALSAYINLPRVNLNMALQDGRTWEQFFIDAKIPKKEAKTYAKLFTDQRISESTIKDLTKDYLQELGITVLGDILLIL